MNLLLIAPEELDSAGCCIIQDERAEHLRKVLKVSVGQNITCGIRNGMLGTALIEAVLEKGYRLRVSCTLPPPPATPLILVLALPRPKSLRKVLHCCAVMGVKDIHIFRSWRSEKGYWDNPILSAESIEAILREGLMQGVDTRMPRVQLHPLFRPFVEDLLPGIAEGSLRLLAHPYTEEAMPRTVQEPVTLVIGPEGGFIEFEVELLKAAGFIPVTTGPRIMRVEQAVPAILGRLF